MLPTLQTQLPLRISPAHLIEFFFRVWERGAAETLACGTGASAATVACVLNRKTGRSVLVHLPGGDLDIEWSEADNQVYMIGPAAEVFEGEI